jgi:hypothetical protein
MKNYCKHAVIIGILSFAAFIAGCKSYTEGYDVSPIAPVSASPTMTFSGAQGAFDEFMEGFPSQDAAMWTQQATGTDRQFTGYYNYTTSAQDFANDWGTAYTGVLNNLRLVQSGASEAGLLNLEAAAKILEGIHMGTVTALWGDVPYSEAVQPLANLTPKFDSQIDAYSEVQTILQAGITELAANMSPLSSDIFSSAGNPNIWIKAAHTAKARYYMHVARYNSYGSADLNNVISEAQLGILATDGSEDLMFVHTGGVWNGNMNLWNSFLVTDRSGYFGAKNNFAVPMMKALALDGKTDDSGRLAYYFTSYGQDLNTSSVGAYSATAPYPIFRASETHLLLAEAYARSGQTGNAITELNNARTYNDNVFGDKSLPFVNTDSAVSGANLLQTIFNEEYLSLMHQVEAFNFARRVNFQIQYSDSTGAIVKLTPTSGSQFPQRFFYPTNEITANPNTPVQSTSDLFKPTTVNSK